MAGGFSQSYSGINNSPGEVIEIQATHTTDIAKH